MKKTIKIVIGVIVIALIGTAIYQSAAKPAKDITFGMIVGSTGQYAFIGENYIKGANLAQKDWNAAHPDKKISLITEDDSFDAKKGLAAYDKLVNINKVDGLINMTSVTVDAIYNQAKVAGLPVAEGGEQGIAPTDDNVFQLLPGNISTEIALGKAVKDKGYRNIVVFVDNNATFARFFDGFQTGYASGGTLSEFKLDPTGTDFRSDVTKALSQNPDAVVFLTVPQQGGILVKEIKTLSNKAVPFAFDASVQTGFQDYKKILGDTKVLDGSLAVTIQSAKSQAFIDEYKAAYNEEPGVAADWAYDSFTLLAKTQNSDKSAWVKNMKSASFEGVGGKVVFDQAGVREPEFKIGMIEGGELPK